MALKQEVLKEVPTTDLTKWKLTCVEGRQVWDYQKEAKGLQTIIDRYLLGLDISKDAPPQAEATTPLEAARKGINFYQQLQDPDGHWAQDYGGPMFLMPGLVITAYITGVDLGEARKLEMIRYLAHIQNADGGWGLHIESKSTIFGTSLNYVAARILGVAKDSAMATHARKFLLDNGGAILAPSWGKFWLCTLGVMDWEGVNAIPPELWLLPYWVPFHPGRWWCHCRIVYLPMGYIYGIRGTGKITPLVESLRQEIYVQDYNKINWSSIRSQCSNLDRYIPQSTFLTLILGTCNVYEKIHSSWVRKKALEKTIAHIKYEDVQTHWICIGPVNKVLNMLSVYYAEGSQTEHFQNHANRLFDYLWLAADGMKMQGYNGSQLWDCAFTVQAILESGLTNEFQSCLKKAHNYIDITQVPVNSPNADEYYRHESKGAWPFSTRDHGWPISDCTAEGLKSVLGLRKLDFIPDFNPERYYDAVNVILSLQNPNGSWATYENQRGPDWVEIFNPAEVFHNIMVDYPYVECTSACVQALAKFRSQFPKHRSSEVSNAIKKGVEMITKLQRSDGSWIGSWGVCFTYAIWFGVEGLVAAGVKVSDKRVTSACKFLLEHQSADGGWGETFQSCVQRKWVQNEKSQVVDTAWSLLALMAAKHPDHAAIARGIKFLMSRQLPNGDWAQEGISGVFNANCAISYSTYKNTFPIWALSRFANHYSSSLLSSAPPKVAAKL